MQEAILMDTQGRIVGEKKLHGHRQETEWMVNSIQAGTYILQLRIDNRFVHIPIIVTR
jgi:hypothetical protein